MIRQEIASVSSRSHFSYLSLLTQFTRARAFWLKKNEIFFLRVDYLFTGSYACRRRQFSPRS